MRCLILLLVATVCLAADSEVFEKQIRPVLANNCYSCHGTTKQFGGLRLDSRDRILRGGQKGPAAIAGNPSESLLIKAVKHEGLKMPMGGKLKPEEISALESWVQQGLPWPEEKAIKLATGDPGFYEKLIHEHWAFQPVRKIQPPDGAAVNPIDRFIATKLAAKGLKLNAETDRNSLARRASFVLTGLPPTQQQLHAFLQNKSPNAYETFVDSLIASPHFGERWARHWMDVTRFAETYGYEWNFEIHDAWRYRDYLIRAFNSDLPYDQFVREHIAGDLLAKPRTQENGRLNESVLATAFFRLGEMGHDNCDQFREIRTDVVDNQIDTLSKAFQGLTVSCARCHDHKIDPIPTEDYYALYGILNSSRPVTRTLDLAGPDAKVRARLTDLKSQIRKALGTAWSKENSNLGRYISAAVAWENDSPDAAEIARGLDVARITQIRNLLKRKKLDMSDPLYPVTEWIKAEPASWQKLADSYRDEESKREKFNAEKFVVFGDFEKELPPGWTGDGWGYRTGRAKDGDFAIETEGGAAVTSIFPAGLFSNLLSDRLNAVIRSPLLPRDNKFVTLQVAGAKMSAYRLVIDDCVIGEDHTLLDNPNLSWLRFSTKKTVPLPAFLELSTKADNPRLPERPEKFKDFDEAKLQSPRSFWGVTKVLLHNEEAEPKQELRHMNRLMTGAAPRDVRELATRFEKAAQTALQDWINGSATGDDVTWLDWLLQNQLLTNSRNLTPELRALTDEYRKVEAALANPAIVYSMADVDKGKDYPILTGGQAAAPGQPAPRHFLTLMPDALKKINPEQSGRREMAEAMASKDNPLTGRVMTNRIWHHVFGRGIAATTDNFGRYGDAPTHPELLDYLTSRFIEEGWSVKKLVRLMVTSETFRQSSISDKKSSEADPQNMLWHRYPVRRLEAEAVRDSILEISGTLNPKMYGPSIQPYRDEARPYRRLFQGKLDGEGRRSIYIKVTRMEGPRFLETFDFPTPMQTRGNRDVTNVPSQALAMLNDPFVVDQSKRWAEKLVTDKAANIDQRLSGMFESALGRTPTANELTRLHQFVDTMAKQHSVDANNLMTSAVVWKEVAHTFFNMKEFLYLR